MMISSNPNEAGGDHLLTSSRSDGKVEQTSLGVRNSGTGLVVRKEPCFYSHDMYKQVARTVATSKQLPLDDKMMSSSGLWATSVNPSCRQLLLKLAYDTLKNEKLLLAMLDSCDFFACHQEFEDDKFLVIVMLNDLLHRQFQQRHIPGEQLDNELLEIEKALMKSKTKINASIARKRIKAQVDSTERLLPDAVQRREVIASSMYVCAWINKLKTRRERVLRTLESEGYEEVFLLTRLSGKTFYSDTHCKDVLLFSISSCQYISSHELTLSGHLVLQDKSACLGPQSARALLNNGEDVLHIGLGTGLSTAHLASLCNDCNSTVYAMGIENEDHMATVKATLDHLGATDKVKIIEGNFLHCGYDDARIGHIKVMLVTAPNSCSGVTDVISFLMTDGQESCLPVLRDLAQGQVDRKSLTRIVNKQKQILRHALQFPKVHGVVYCTSSVINDENDTVVQFAMQQANGELTLNKKSNFVVSPPVLTISPSDLDDEHSVLDGKYLKCSPSSLMYGCFVATIAKEAVDPKETAKDVLARAAALGIIGPLSTVSLDDVSTTSSRKKGKKGRRGNKKSLTEELLVSSGHLNEMLSLSMSPVVPRTIFSSRAALLAKHVPPHKLVLEHPSPFR